MVLCRLGFLLGETRYLQAAERTLRAAWPQLARYPQAHMALLNALEDWTAPPQIVIIRGGAADCRRWQIELTRRYAPKRLVFAIPQDAAGLPPALAGKPAATATLAYVCTGMACSAPITDLGELLRALEAGTAP